MSEKEHKELWTLAAAIYDEVCRVFNRETGGNEQTKCPLSEQSEPVRQAYFRGAVVSNTLAINRLLHESARKEDRIELALSFTPDEWKKMKSTLEAWDQKEMSDDEVMSKLTVWADKSIYSNIHSIELQMKYKP